MIHSMAEVLKDNADRLWKKLGEGGSSPSTRKGSQAAIKALSNRKIRKSKNQTA